MARTVKCQRCGVSDTVKTEMSVDYVGAKNTPKYYHHNCFEEHMKEKAFKEQERVELDKLVEVIKKIYGVKTIPNNAYPYLQDLRNGTKFFGKYDYKYKEGYTYDLIAETFDYCSDTIEYWNARKSFNGFTNALRYGLAIVCDKLSIVEQRRKDREKQRLMIERQIENMKDDEQVFESNFKKKKPSKRADITDFLDD
jgi:hypothetical protein